MLRLVDSVVTEGHEWVSGPETAKVLLSVAHVTTEDHADVCGPICHTKLC